MSNPPPSKPAEPNKPSPADSIEDLLPQTQCTKCGYPACRPYAEAIADGSANYNQCPPGGQQGIARLAGYLGKPVIPLNPVNGVEKPRTRAFIDEAICIGCTLCIQACPVDPAEAVTELEGLKQANEADAAQMAELKEKLQASLEALATANAAHAQTIAELQRTGKVDVTNRF